jgi:hypothetical protein
VATLRQRDARENKTSEPKSATTFPSDVSTKFKHHTHDEMVNNNILTTSERRLFDRHYPFVESDTSELHLSTRLNTATIPVRHLWRPKTPPGNWSPEGDMEFNSSPMRGLWLSSGSSLGVSSIDTSGVIDKEDRLQTYPILNQVMDYSVASSFTISHPSGSSTVPAGIPPEPIMPHIMSRYRVYPTSQYSISPASLSASVVSNNYRPSAEYSMNGFSQIFPNGHASQMHLEQSQHPWSPSSDNGIAAYEGFSFPPIMSASSEPTVIQKACFWRGCTAPIISAPPDQMKQRFRLHFAQERHIDDHVLHDGLCQWAGCICSCTRRMRCSNLGPGHPAHVKDIVHHIMKTHISE